ncbi:hypothetical protein SUDANB1_05631 [Streptomyces sp. enrichment culture]|uniref:hypothetical protein n=1 Tax=Streptomyces sp. enrichment culture TaxID=1795815 RepID=UPI003F5674A2
MSVLPRSVPQNVLQELREVLATVGAVAEFMPNRRVTLTTEYAGATWTLTYIGHGYVWSVRGPGAEHGPAVFTQELADFLRTATQPAKDGDPCLPHQVAHCGHCPHDACKDCEQCPCSCRCAAVVVRKVTPGTAAPRTHMGVPVPTVVREQWDTPHGEFWRLGVRSALAVC